MALKVKVGIIGILDMLKFKSLPKVRRDKIKKTGAKVLPGEYGTNKMARLLHPNCQILVIDKIIDEGMDVKSYILKSAESEILGYFRAGQYISIIFDINGSKVTRPYTLSSSPKESVNGEYMITIKRSDNGFVSNYILDNWKVGAKIEASGAHGNFYYEGLRDGKHVLALAGGSGITPFLSMAKAIAEGTENFKLTILYGSRTYNSVIFNEEFSKIMEVTDKVKLINVLSDENSMKPLGEGYEKGLVSEELISKYMQENSSIFICGPQGMYKFLDKELEKLNIEQKYIRRELFGSVQEPWNENNYPIDQKDKKYKLTVKNCGVEHIIECFSNENILVAIEKSGIFAPSRCRSGKCGYCHSRLVSGEVFIPKDSDGRRAGDLVYGYIHPCSTFPLGNITIEIPGSYILN